MYIINRLNVTAISTALRVLLLAVIPVLSFVVVAAVMPYVLSIMTIVVSAVTYVITVAIGVTVSAATFAFAMLVRAAVLILLCWLWQRMPSANWRIVITAAKGLALAGVVVGVFVVALVWLPAILTTCCTVLPQVATVGAVFGGVVGLMKMG